MDIHVDIRGFLEIYAWICYWFSDQGTVFEIQRFEKSQKTTPLLILESNWPHWLF